MSADTTMLRAIANALWPFLRRGRWRTHTVTRDLSKYNPRGYTAGPRSATVAQSPSASAVIELHRESFITAVLYAEDWPGGTSHALRLDRREYTDTLLMCSPDDVTQYAIACDHATCRAPFHAQANRHGVMRLRRNGMDEFITTGAAAILESIAASTRVLPISEATIDDFLIEDHEINLDQVRAAVGSM